MTRSATSKPGFHISEPYPKTHKSLSRIRWSFRRAAL